MNSREWSSLECIQAGKNKPQFHEQQIQQKYKSPHEKFEKTSERKLSYLRKKKMD